MLDIKRLSVDEAKILVRIRQPPENSEQGRA